MSPHTTIAIEDLRRALNRALDDVASAHGDRIDLVGGLYWQVPASALRAIDPGTIELTAGELSDDVDTMHRYLASRDPTPALWHELNHLVGVLRAIEAHALP